MKQKKTLKSDIRGINVKKISSNTTKTVGKDIAKYLEKPTPNTVLLITHSGMWNVTHWTKKEQYTLFFDEVFEPIVKLDVKISYSEPHIGLFSRLFRVEDCLEYPDQYKLVVKDSKLCESIIHHQHDDDIFEIFGELCSKITSPHWNCYIDKIGYEKFQSCEFEDGRCRLAIVGTFNTDIFKRFSTSYIS